MSGQGIIIGSGGHTVSQWDWDRKKERDQERDRLHRHQREGQKSWTWKDSFGKWKRSNDACMTPDRGFVKQLKMLDKEFEVVWDWGKEKWEIWRIPKDGSLPLHMCTVETKGKGYRELGADVLMKLREGDPTRFTLNELISYWDEMDDQILRRKKEAFSQKLRDFARDSFTNIHCKIIQVPREMKIRRAITDEC